ISLPRRLMYLPSAGGIVGNRATVRLTTTITTAAITNDQTHNLPTRRRFGCLCVPPQAGGAPSSAIERQVRSLLSPAAIIGATVSPTIPAGLLPGCWVINSTTATNVRLCRRVRSVQRGHRRRERRHHAIPGVAEQEASR